ncbi:MAG: M81 family metallopeptidase [Rikenellaceae bacterium]
MKKLSLLLLTSFLVFACSKEEVKPRIAITGIAIESSTFSPARTTLDMFRILRGEDIFSAYPFLKDDSAPLRQSAQWLPGFTARATPGGTVTREAYDALVKESLDSLRSQLPLDGIFFDIHGAMSVEGLEDPEGDYIAKVREVVGDDVMISTSMDLHGCVSETLARESNLITCYRLAPHEDWAESKERTVQNLVDRLKSGKGNPKYKAWVKVPVLLPGEQTSTRVEPGKSLYAKVDPLTKSEGVIDAAIWISYAWADEPRNHAVIMAYGDSKEEVQAAAESLAKDFWDVREEFEFVAPTASLEECFAEAIKSDAKPYFVSDMGDNPTAGGAGDVTWTIEQLLKMPYFKQKGCKTLVYASIPDSKILDEIVKAGVKSRFSGKFGAEVDNRYAGPVEVKNALIDTIVLADKTRLNVREAVLSVGGIKIIVTEKRKPFHYVSDFKELGIDLAETDIVMVKMGYLVEELYDVQKGWMMAQTRGGVDQDMFSLPYKGIQRPMYPLDNDFDFTPVVCWY